LKRSIRLTEGSLRREDNVSCPVCMIEGEGDSVSCLV
jgi:hypothetical protein